MHLFDQTGSGPGRTCMTHRIKTKPCMFHRPAAPVGPRTARRRPATSSRALDSMARVVPSVEKVRVRVGEMPAVGRPVPAACRCRLVAVRPRAGRSPRAPTAAASSVRQGLDRAGASGEEGHAMRADMRHCVGIDGPTAWLIRFLGQEPCLSGRQLGTTPLSLTYYPVPGAR